MNSTSRAGRCGAAGQDTPSRGARYGDAYARARLHVEAFRSVRVSSLSMGQAGTCTVAAREVSGNADDHPATKCRIGTAATGPAALGSRPHPEASCD